AGRVLQEDDRHVGLVAELDELRGLGGAFGVDRAVIPDQPDRLALDAGLAADRRTAPGRLEIGEIAGIDQTRDHLAYVIGLAVIDRQDAAKLVDVVGGRPRGLLRQSRGALAPGQALADLARDADRIGIVLGEIFRNTADMGVHLAAAEFLISGD